jgi:hypothetical protein
LASRCVYSPSAGSGGAGISPGKMALTKVARSLLGSIVTPRLPEPEGMAQADVDGPLSRRGRDRGGAGNFRGL